LWFSFFFYGNMWTYSWIKHQRNQISLNKNEPQKNINTWTHRFVLFNMRVSKKVPTSTGIVSFSFCRNWSTDLIAFAIPPATEIWLSFIITISNKPSLWFFPPPISTYMRWGGSKIAIWGLRKQPEEMDNNSTKRKGMLTAHLSTRRKPGAVFLVSNMHAGRAASDIAWTEQQQKLYWKYQMTMMWSKMIGGLWNIKCEELAFVSYCGLVAIRKATMSGVDPETTKTHLWLEVSKWLGI